MHACRSSQTHARRRRIYASLFLAKKVITKREHLLRSNDYCYETINVGNIVRPHISAYRHSHRLLQEYACAINWNIFSEIVLPSVFGCRYKIEERIVRLFCRSVNRYLRNSRQSGINSSLAESSQRSSACRKVLLSIYHSSILFGARTVVVFFSPSSLQTNVRHFQGQLPMVLEWRAIYNCLVTSCFSTNTIPVAAFCEGKENGPCLFVCFIQHSSQSYIYMNYMKWWAEDQYVPWPFAIKDK